jgi:signal transduction histidine kinase
MLEDITEARANQEALDQARLLESNGRLTATMAHEINNALTGILGLAQVLEEEMDPGQSWDDIEEIRKAAAQAMQTARRLMKR